MFTNNIFRYLKFFLIFGSISQCFGAERPHIVFILADDLGWNDVGFHGMNHIPTPNIDALAYSGIILNNYYVTPICTPSRSALMTGKYPIHTGMQHQVLHGCEPRGLPLSEKILPQYLKDLGYVNRIVGKWHLGSFTKNYTPTYRGFESHLGYWTGHHDYNDHTAQEDGLWGLDMRRNLEVAYDLHGKYTTDIITNESVRLIKNHNSTKPLFLYVAHAAVHSSNDYNPLPAPDKYVEMFPNITNYKRRRFAAMLTKLDESVGEIVNALSNAGMLSNSIIVFSTDNGGPADGFNRNAASNYPLRGVKNTLWEGGIRGAGFLWSTHLKKSQRIANQKMHITDWLPTLYTAAGGNSDEIVKGLDAIDMWKALSEDLESNRTEILHNLDDIYKIVSVSIGDWKIMKGTNYAGEWDSWYGPAGEEGFYNENNIINSKSGVAAKNAGMEINSRLISNLREETKIQCNNKIEKISCHPLAEVCLYNTKEDPCEYRNLANEPGHKSILQTLLNAVNKYNSTALPPGNLPIDPRCQPRFWNYTWTNFGDYL